MLDTDAHETRKWLNDLAHLSSGIGHHVINAFSAIVSNAELIRLRNSMSVPTDPTVMADTIIRTALEASGVARRLIDFTRPITSVGDESMDINDAIEEFVANEREHGPIGVEWVLSLGQIPLVRGHREAFQVMLGHLVANAYDAMRPEGTEIRFETSVDSRNWIAIELSDTGMGMSQETLERAVEPFFTTKPAHIGIGLSIANGCWRRHKGTLAVRSQPGRGTTVRLCIEGLPPA